MKINKKAIESLKKFYLNKIKREQKVVEEEYEFWKIIDNMAEEDNENLNKK